MKKSETDWRGLHKLAVEDDRWQVQLNWDRTRFFLLFNTTLLGAAAALVRTTAARSDLIFVAALLLIGAFVSFHGAAITRAGKRYHRAAVVNVILAASRAPIPDPSKSTVDDAFVMPAGITPEKAMRIRAAPAAYVASPVSPTSMTGRVILILRLLAVTQLVAGAAVVHAAMA